MRHAILAAALILAASPAVADEVLDAIDAARLAYEEGDLAGAKQELDFAIQFLGQLKAEGLQDFLPPALDGWTRRESETQSAAAGMFGGGLFASASYTDDRDSVQIQLIAESPMIATMAMLFSNPAMMGSQGKLKRIGRQRAMVNNNGEIQALIDNRIMVQIDGSAPIEIKEAYFESIDFDALSRF